MKISQNSQPLGILRTCSSSFAETVPWVSPLAQAAALGERVLFWLLELHLHLIPWTCWFAVACSLPFK